MNVKNNNSTKKTISLVLLVLVVALAVNNSLYIHVHSFNGKSVVHAHPYQKSDTGNSGSNHEHTGFELFLLNTFQSFLFCAFLTGLLIILTKGVEIIVTPLISTLKREIEIRYGRAPPVHF
jgi:hypothetical protein